MRRTLLGGLAAVLAFSSLGIVGEATAAPAHHAVAAKATTTQSTTSKFSSDVKTRGLSGDYLSISGSVKTGSGDSPLAGTAILQRQLPGSKKWKNVQKDGDPGFAYFPKVKKFTTNYSLRIVFTGGTYKGGSSNIKYSPSISKTIVIQAGRVIHFTDATHGRHQPVAKIRISPDFGRSKFILQRKFGKKYKTIRKVKTSAKGGATISVQGSQKGIVYRIIAPGGKLYVSTSAAFRATVYR